MWYKHDNNVGMRRKFDDKKQIFSFGGKRTSFSQEGLMQLGYECSKKLDAGMIEADVKHWVVEMCGAKP